MYTLGTPATSIFLAAENDKLAVEFTTAAAVKKGQPVKINAAGNVTPWASADGRSSFIGTCMFDAASGDLVTVITRGYIIVNAISGGALACGLATFSAMDASGYPTYVITATDTQIIGWVLDPAAGAGTVGRVLLMG